jgi:signal transduction histidine kinase
VAATGSDPHARGNSRFALPRRFSLRLRLTLLYGVCFLLASAAVLAITYLLFAHDTSGQTHQLQVPGAHIQTHHTGAQARIVVEGEGVQVRFTVPLGIISGSRYSNAQLTRVRAGAVAMSKCMRAHGLDYPNLIVAPDPITHGLQIGFSHAEMGSLRPLDLRSRRFRAANATCSRLLDKTLPSKKSIANGSSLQKQLNLIIHRANGALVTQRSRSLRTLLTWSGVALGAMAVVSILLGWLLAGKSLRPLRAMASRARRINEETLHERLSADAGEDELGDLATTFDDVLARLERAFNAHKHFVANASHELRTPVTIERALLELALSLPDADAETLRHTCERVLASNKQQQQMIEALLTLARSQGGTDTGDAVDLADLAQDAITLRAQRLEDITLAADLHPAPLTGDPALLERLVTNLIDNAIVHNVASGAWITVETGNESTGSWLRVSNSGPEVPESMIPEIFEPFRRIEGERTATASGFGLGLSIVQAIADVHGAAIAARQVEGGGLEVEVRF